MNFNEDLSIDEEWCLVKNFPEYEVSIYGRVFSIKAKRNLLLSKNNSGYLSVTLYNQYGPKSHFVHHLVVDAFLRIDRVGFEVNHIDGDKTNNFINNLEIVTRSENLQHALNNNLRFPPNEKSVRILETGEIFKSISDCCRFIGAHPSNMTAVLHGRRKSLKRYTFEFVD